MPDVRIRWRDVWVGASITALLFVAGRFAIGLYLGTRASGRRTGVAGSLIIILVWIYYSSLIVFFGGEFTQIWSNRKVGNAHPVEGTVSAPAGPSQDALQCV